MKNVLALTAVALLLSACASTISNGAGGGPLELLPAPLKNQARKDLIATAYNLDEAQRIGLLPAQSRAPSCQHQINQALGIEPDPNAPAVQSFEPKRDGVVSAASILYLELFRLKSQSRVIEIPQDCATVFGTIQLQALGEVLDVAGGVPIAVVP